MCSESGSLDYSIIKSVSAVALTLPYAKAHQHAGPHRDGLSVLSASVYDSDSIHFVLG